MPDCKDRFSENESNRPTVISRDDSSASGDGSASTDSTRQSPSKKRRGNGRKQRNKGRGGATDKQGREATEKIGASNLKSDREEVILEVDGKECTIRVIGRSQTQSAALLMLGFWMSAEDASAPDREILIAGRALSELSPAQLESAYQESRPPPRDLPRDFFSDIRGRNKN